MTTTPDRLRALALDVADERDNLQDVAESLDTLVGELAIAAAEFPPPVPAPALPDVRYVFDHGGEWGTRDGWAAALNRAPRRRSMWTTAGSVKMQETWIAKFVTDVMTDDGKTAYIVGVSPNPGSEYNMTTLKAHYAWVGNQLARLNAEQRARVFIRFGWEPNGDWYPHSFAPKGGEFESARIVRYIAAWEQFRASTPDGVRLVLNFSGAGAVKDPALFQRIANEVRPDVVSVDVYPMWENRDSWDRQRQAMEVARAVARHLDLPWAVDEWSPYVNKLVSGQQRGNLDGKVACDSMRGAYAYVQQCALDGDAPLWVQMFERRSAEGDFAVVSYNEGPGDYRTAGGAKRLTAAPRVAAVTVALLGNFA